MPTPVHAGHRVDDRFLLESLLEERHGVQVWRATQHPLKREVVVKLVPQGDDPTLTRRFRREAEALGRLNHPACVDAFDHGSWEGWLYLVTAWIPGPLLVDRMGRRWEVSEALAVVTDIASGLAYAHARGVVHRDLNPSRIVLSADEGSDQERAIMVDFASARFAGSQHDTTAGGAPYGTPGYMAPERIEGQRGDERGDVYALGLILYELLTGGHPFRRERAIETLAAQAIGTLPDLATLSPPVRVPRALSWTLDRATRRDPAERLADGEALTAALVACRVALSDRRIQALEPALVDGQLVLPAALSEPVTTSRTRPVPIRRSGTFLAVVLALALLGLNVLLVLALLVWLVLA